MDSKMVRHYETVKGEATRLSQGSHRVEFERTKEILLRDLPPPSAQILDLAGGPGVYSFWLADKSYKVHLVDIVPLHVEQAKAADSDGILASICQGDARCLDFESDSMDVVLLLGPLYHLQERSDRIRALRETHRVLKKTVWLSVLSFHDSHPFLMDCGRDCCPIPIFVRPQKKICKTADTSIQRKSHSILRQHTCTRQKNYQRRLKKRGFAI